MKKNFILLLCLSLFWGCGDIHFIEDTDYRAKVSNRFDKRKEFAKNRSNELFDVFNQNLTVEEREALEFLYAYMPLCDLADYDGDFFLKQVRSAFEARNSFDWGRKVPEELFRHFVLPYRVNNENLDSARQVFLKELKPRLQGLSMKKAALEVNHWCHEKVNYTPTDIRTSGPLSLVRTSWGRCGEESTFTVTALRAVGIPARQVYTPRWAHSDDNHAWVEVWTDGKWSYLGACEPEPDLNMGWFTEPARRAMLVHTKMFGDYKGQAEIVNSSENFTEINVVGNYAEVKKVFVKLIDENHQPVQNANVDFGLYNYAEFYPIVSKKTDEFGITYLTTGLGDLLIWATKDQKFAGRKMHVESTDTLILELGKGFYGGRLCDLSFTPPVEKKTYPVDETLKKENDRRLAIEDSIRREYRETFIDSIEACKFAQELGFNQELIWNRLNKSQGNYLRIQEYLKNIKSSDKEGAVQLLQQVSDKDLRDTDAEILMDHFGNTVGKFNLKDYKNKSLFWSYVLNPRVKNEKLVAYRRYLQREFENKITGRREEKIEKIKKWILNEIQINEADNYYSLPITPLGVFELRISNKESRDIFFVALCRSCGIPSRLEPAEKIPQYYNGEEWVNVYFEGYGKKQPVTGFVSLSKDSGEKDFDPEYYIHFTIGKLVDGKYESLDLGWGNKFSNLPSKIELEVGEYRLVTGKRAVNGTIFTRLNHFTISEDKIMPIVLKFRDTKSKKKVFGRLNLEEKITDRQGSLIPLRMLEKQKLIVLMWLEPGKEPTRHLMEEFKSVKNNYESWDGTIAVVQGEGIQTENLSESFFKNMPSNYAVYKDVNDVLLSKVKVQMDIKGKVQKPLILVINSGGKIVFVSNGYKIGVHDHLLEVLKAE